MFAHHFGKEHNWQTKLVTWNVHLDLRWRRFLEVVEVNGLNRAGIQTFVFLVQGRKKKRTHYSQNTGWIPETGSQEQFGNQCPVRSTDQVEKFGAEKQNPIILQVTDYLQLCSSLTSSSADRTLQPHTNAQNRK